jgi:hypothetical protein
MRNRMKHRTVGRLALPLAALALAAPAQAAAPGSLAHVPSQSDGKSSIIGHPDGTDGYQPQLQANESPKLELRRQAPPGYVPEVYVTSSDSARDIAPLSRRGQSPVAVGGDVDWADTGIGAGVAFGGILLVGGLALAMRKGRRTATA